MTGPCDLPRPAAAQRVRIANAFFMPSNAHIVRPQYASRSRGETPARQLGIESFCKAWDEAVGLQKASMRPASSGFLKRGR